MRLAALIVAGLAAGVAAAPAAGKLQPTLARSVLVKPAGGVVMVTPIGTHKPQRLRRATLVKVGSTIDTTHGKVRLIAAVDRHRHTDNGVFSEGGFVVTQEANGQTDLTLTGATLGKCTGASQGTASAAATPKRRLFGHAHGRFRTIGRNSSATVRGTVWLTEDRCDGTRIEAQQGQVDTQSQGTTFTLKPGQNVTYFCNEMAFNPGDYCVVLLLQPADGIFGAGFGEVTDLTQYDLCVTDPQGRQTCTTYPLEQGDPPTFHRSAVLCRANSGAGTYTVSWRLGGQLVFPTLSGFVGAPTMQLPCLHQP
jgi:hypothetical protein